MTRTAAIAAIGKIPGMVARSTGCGAEIRVTYRGIKADRAEELAYYSDDPDDSHDTAKLMAEKQPV